MSDNYDNECIICFEPLNKLEEEIGFWIVITISFQMYTKMGKKTNLNNSCCICEGNNEIINVISNNPLFINNNQNKNENINTNNNQIRNNNQINNNRNRNTIGNQNNNLFLIVLSCN